MIDQSNPWCCQFDDSKRESRARSERQLASNTPPAGDHLRVSQQAEYSKNKTRAGGHNNSVFGDFLYEARPQSARY
jgi:hypothetical protein